MTIVHRLERAAGVTVQGPPGTGKTHTIANIICHYLATGKRVLVTSRGEPALKVLQSKIPEEVRPLTVALLTNDREGMRQFQASIESIQHRVSQLIPEETQQQIHVLRQAIGRAHTELETIDRRVDEVALSQLSEIEVDGVLLRAQKMAELVMDGNAQHGWFDDALSLAPEHMPPLSEADAARLRECRRKLGPDLCYVHAITPSTDELPAPEAIAHNVLIQIKRSDELVGAGMVLALKSLTQEVIAACHQSPYKNNMRCSHDSARAAFVRRRRIAIPATTSSWAALDAGGKGAGSSSASVRSAETLHIRRLENGLERPCSRSRPAPRHLASLVVADAFAG